MVVNKQVRVDNWGVFFLQRLQMFFSRTDYCDLTLQFEGNVQLKVHRLVMNACTDYFTFLEQNCASIDENTIMMPNELQADVIVPIVNFMYTGLLEFQTSSFEKLYKASELMRLNVLTKLLDAQKQFIAKPQKKARPVEPPASVWPQIKKQTLSKPTSSNHELAAVPQSGKKSSIWKKKTTPVVPASHPTSQMQFTEPRWNTERDPLAFSESTAKPTRFEWPDDDLPLINPLETSFEDFSYTSKPLLTKEDEVRAGGLLSKPCSSKDSNDFSELCIFGEGEESSNEIGKKRKIEQVPCKLSPKRTKISSDKENKETTISVKANNASEMDHTKIVTEILKKYPELVKKNKSIRLKIMQSSNKSSEKKTSSVGKLKHPKQEPLPVPKIKKKRAVTPSEDGPWSCNVCSQAGESKHEFVLYYLYRKHMTDVHNEVFDIRLCKYCGKSCPKHRLMMYHMFVKHGLKPPATYDFPTCDRCPYIGLSVPKLLQHQRRHQQGEEQCLHCKLAFASQTQLSNHIRSTNHDSNTKISNSKHDCQYCTKRMPSGVGLLGHLRQVHLKEATRDGVVGLDEELEDYEEEEEDDGGDNETTQIEYIVPNSGSEDKVKILSDVKVPENRSQQMPTQQQDELVQDEPANNAELNSAAGNLASSLGLVDIVVMDEDRQYVLRQNTDGAQEFMLPTEFASGSGFTGQVITTATQQSVLQTSSGSDIASTDELVMVLTDHDYQEDHDGGSNTDNSSNIVVLYSHPVDGQQGQFITSQGNLLVNSQTGMLEIRNGSAIAAATTNSNQIIVNASENSPMESIEMIQREIQNHNSMKAPTAPVANQTLFEEEQKPDIMTQQVISQDLINHEDTAADETIPQSRGKQLKEEQQEEIPSVALPEEQSTQPDESIPEQMNAEELVADAKKDLLPAEDNHQQPQDSNNLPSTATTTDAVPNTDTSTEEDRPVSEETTDAVDHSQETPMDIDEDEPKVTTADENEKNVETFIEPEIETATSSGNKVAFEEMPQEGQQEEASVDIPPKKIIDNDSVEHSAERARESDKSEQINWVEIKGSRETGEIEISLDEPMDVVDGNKKEIEQRDEHLDETVVEVVNQSASTTEKQTIEEEDNDGEEEDGSNSQSSHGTAVTNKESLDHNHKIPANVNQTILDDWDDTDSQQSEKHQHAATVEEDESRSDGGQGSGDAVAIAEAAEKVNKLMDDWEEEDEDEKRDQ